MCIVYLQEANGNRQSNAGGAERSFALRYRPRVSLELAEQVSQIHIHSMHRLKKSKHNHKHTLVDQRQELHDLFLFFNSLNEVLMLLPTCRGLKRPEVLVGDLVVPVLRASLNPAFP